MGVARIGGVLHRLLPLDHAREVNMNPQQQLVAEIGSIRYGGASGR
ncbi:hypothetical protein OWC43_05670 [Methylorubrum sp. POS3]